MNQYCRLRIVKSDYDVLIKHLFPGDEDEHGAVLLAGYSHADNRLYLHVREVHLAREGIDYVKGKIGHRALNPQFIHQMIARARDQNMAYLAVHNHGSDQHVSFSKIDFDSHERGYPALLQISRGNPVGALVLGHRAMQADVWLSNGHRLDLDQAEVIGTTITRLTPQPLSRATAIDDQFDRQIRFFGKDGQTELNRCHVAIIGLGGIGSLVAEYLGRLGIGKFTLIDSDILETSNLSRVVGASMEDARVARAKVDIAKNNILMANPQASVAVIQGDVAIESVAKQIIGCDYLFLAADSMRARLVVNAITHQYFVPSVQMGAKVLAGPNGTIADLLSVNRPIRPGQACLWCNQLIDPHQLAKESKTDEERKAQAYGVQELNPSVVTLNAISAAHAVNDFMLDYLGLRPNRDEVAYEHFHHLTGVRKLVQPRRDAECPECSRLGHRFGRGDEVKLPCIEG